MRSISSSASSSSTTASIEKQAPQDVLLAVEPLDMTCFQDTRGFEPLYWKGTPLAIECTVQYVCGLYVI